MWKYSFIFFLLLLLGFGKLMAQQGASISFQLFDTESREPLEAGTVRIFRLPDSSLLAGVLTDSSGNGAFYGLSNGEYQIEASFIGYESQKKQILVGRLNKFYDLGKWYLIPSGAELGEINIEGQKSLASTSLDRKSFTLDENISQAGSSTLDAMRNLPGITVDAEGKVLLRGSDQVAILIDGKQSSLTGFGNQQGLENIPASNIERIEIINNPSAKYDASGMAGIINIVYKTEKEEGLKVDLGFTYGLGELTTRREDLPTELGRFSLNPKYLPSLRLNYIKSNWNAFLRAEVLRQKKLPNNEFNIRSYEDGRIIASQVPENRTQTQYIVNAGFDWQMNGSNRLGFSALMDYENHVDTAQVPYINLLSDARNRYWHWSERETTGYLNFQSTYEHQFRQAGHKLETSLQYTRGIEDEQYFLTDSSEFRQGQDTTHIIAVEHTGVFLLNYTKPLSSGRLEAGSKIQLRRIPITYEIGQGEASVLYPEVGNSSRWGESVYAAYLNYIWEKKRYEVEAGLRAEQTFVFYDLDSTNIYYPQNDAYQYFELYPNVRFTLKLHPRHGISVFYNRRVDRPGEPELRVFPKFDDPELLKVGNPYLRPQFTQTFELAYRFSWEKGSLYFSGYHRLINNPFTRVYSIDTTSTQFDIVNRIYQNVGRGSQTGIEVLVSQQVSNSWKLSASFNLYQNTIQAFSGELLFPYVRPFSIPNTQSTTWDVKINNQFELSQRWQLQLTGLYYAPFNIPQGRQLSRASIDLGVKRVLWEGKGEILLSVTDMFNQFGIRQEIVGLGFTNEYENLYETQVFRLGFRYKF
ncbi:MAG: TonB-dependent receptor family protein [Bacteroidia bacterium]|nr:TonB-dependent receptor family protein [Bacteroidia bacterium]